MNHDAFNSASSRASGVGVMKIVDALHAEAPHIQIHAVTAAFILTCEKHGITDMNDLFTKTRKLMRGAEEEQAFSPEMTAARRYMEQEW